MNNTVTLKEFMTMFAPQLEKKVEETLKPVYIMQQGHEDFGSLTEPYPIQREIVRALHAGYKEGNRSLFLTAEMGSGKTLQSIWIAEKLKAKRVLVVCPPHLVGQWKEEIIKAYPSKRVATIPDAGMRKLGISDMMLLQKIHEDKNLNYVIISREAIKTQLSFKPAILYNKVKEETVCPACFAEIDFRVSAKLHKAKCFCDQCKSALFQYHKKDGRSKPSLANYIKKQMKGYFHFTVFDEVHELKAGDTAQGAMLGKLATQTRSLCNTGTFMGGKASDIYYLLYRTNPDHMKLENLDYSSVTRFVEKYGILEKRFRTDDQDNTYSIGRRRNQEDVRERPGLSPLVIGKFLIDKSVFLRLSDFSEKLPLYIEHPVACQMHPDAKAGYDILLEYKSFLREACKPAKIISSAIQAMLRYMDTHEEEVICDQDENGNLLPLLVAPQIDIPIGETKKEQKLLEIIKGAKQERNKILVFTTQTKKRDLQPRIQKLLEGNGIRTAILHNTVTTGKRRAWIEAKTPKIDALICHPKLVSTGMNLLEYPVIVFFDTGYSTYTLRQASRRSYRINQKKEQIDVYYLYTEKTIQQDCLSLMACKNEVSLLVEGEIQDGGLSALSDSAGSILSELAKVINGELKTENPLEVFARLNKLNNENKKKPRPEMVQPAIAMENEIIVPHLPISPTINFQQISLF
jgi:SNF2 family DNA or RNA helicase